MREPIEFDSPEQCDRVLAEIERLSEQFDRTEPQCTNPFHKHNPLYELYKQGNYDMNMNDAFPTKYLKASDVEDEPVLTIQEMKVEVVGQGDQKKKKCILYFEELSKGLVLNKINWKTIAELLGTDETDEWEGQRVQLYSGTAQFQGEEVDAIRVRKQKKKTQTQKPAKAVATRVPQSAEEDDSIPF